MTARETVEESLSFRRLTRPQPDGQVQVTIQALVGRKQVGRITQGRRLWRWQVRTGTGQAGRQAQEGWTATAEEAKERVREALTQVTSLK